jgi:hypothetical protein
MMHNNHKNLEYCPWYDTCIHIYCPSKNYFFVSIVIT